MVTKPVKDSLLKTVERHVRNVLRSSGTSSSEKLKAAEIAIKVMAIQHKIKSGEEESFFDD